MHLLTKKKMGDMDPWDNFSLFIVCLCVGVMKDYKLRDLHASHYT